jgi:hypothetical protein
MTIKCLNKCGEICQRNIAATIFTIMGVMSVATVFLVLVSF